jgi:hypothetical protein
MTYFVLMKNSENVISPCSKIADNDFDLNNSNINLDDYKIIKDTEINYNNVKFGKKSVLKYIGNTITFIDDPIVYPNKDSLKNYIDGYKKSITQFIDNNPNHILLDRWKKYYNQLNSLNLNTIEFPLNKSLEQYFLDTNQTAFHPLQVP